MAEFLQVTTTAGSREEAERIALALVERRFAGCVQIIGPMTSIYRWQGQVEQAAEWLCLIKTTRSRYADVEQTILELHSYECPEIIAMPIEAGSPAYLEWLAKESTGGG
jgi:periplasmic divalent cation tolerance protein